jgi:hypothetical protein
MQYCKSSRSLHVPDTIVEDLPKRPLQRVRQKTSHTHTHTYTPPHAVQTVWKTVTTMAGPLSKDGNWPRGQRVTGDGQGRRNTAEMADTAVRIVHNNNGADRHGRDSAAAPNQPPSTNPTRGPTPRRNRTKELAATRPLKQWRKTTTMTQCCECTRHSTCTSLGAKGRPGCACLLAGRKCSGCTCFWQCQNKRILLPESTSDRNLSCL